MTEVAAISRFDNQRFFTDGSLEHPAINRHQCNNSTAIDNLAISPSPSPSETSSSFPSEIRIWPQLILNAARQKLGGAIRIWSFAKALDPSGSGVIKKDLLLSYLQWLGIPSASRYRWIKCAMQHNLLHPVRNGDIFLINGIQKIGKQIDCSDIGPRCLVNAKHLTNTHWKSRAWDLVLTQFKNRPISRAALCQITGIPARTQLELERFGLVQVKRNWCITNIHPDLLTPLTEFSHSHAFIARIGEESHIVYQLPNHYTVPKLSGTPDGGNYRRKTYTAASTSVKSETPETIFSGVRFPENTFRDRGARCGKIFRLYFDREKPFTRALKRLGRAEIEGILYQKIAVPKIRSQNGWYREESI